MKVETTGALSNSGFAPCGLLDQARDIPTVDDKAADVGIVDAHWRDSLNSVL